MRRTLRGAARSAFLELAAALIFSCGLAIAATASETQEAVRGIIVTIVGLIMLIMIVKSIHDSQKKLSEAGAELHKSLDAELESLRALAKIYDEGIALLREGTPELAPGPPEEGLLGECSCGLCEARRGKMH
jgi:hypothetical protein